MPLSKRTIPSPCPICKKQYWRNHPMNMEYHLKYYNHITNKYEHPEYLECDCCSIKFKHLRSLERHLRNKQRNYIKKLVENINTEIVIYGFSLNEEEDLELKTKDEKYLKNILNNIGSFVEKISIARQNEYFNNNVFVGSDYSNIEYDEDEKELYEIYEYLQSKKPLEMPKHMIEIN